MHQFRGRILIINKMGLISGIVGAGMQAAGAIYGGIQAAKANRAITNNLNEQQQKNQDWYNRNYNEDATQRADAQRLLTMTEKSILSRNKAAEASAAIMGSSPEAVAAQKTANNQAIADAASQINAQSENRKSAVEQQYQSKDAAIDAQKNQMQANKAAAIGQSVQALGAVADTINNLGNQKFNQ